MSRVCKKCGATPCAGDRLLCVACVRDQDRIRAAADRARDPEKNRQKQARYRARHLDRLREKGRAHSARYYAAHREELLQRNKQPDRRQYKREYFRAHRDKAKAYYAANRERILARTHEYRRQLSAEARQRLRKVERITRRARDRGASGRFTLEQLAARLAYYGARCYLCGAPWEHWDHVIPLARGGSNWPSNLRPACATCNVRKWAHMPVLQKAA